jgi:heme exporter protein A
MIRVRGLVKHFGLKPVLRGLQFDVEEGEFVALVGPNGAGKTTFLRILTSLARPNAGLVTIAGYRIPGQEGPVRQMLGVVGHQTLLYGDLTAAENLRFYSRMYAVEDGPRRVKEVLGLVGLARVQAELVRSFSRGMQQRLAIARAILHEPQLLLLDEPHTGLDQEAALMLDGLLNEVAVEGRTVVMTSHDLARAHKLATRVDVLSGGVIADTMLTDSISADDLAARYRSATHV